MIPCKVHPSVATLEPVGVGEGDKQVENQEYAAGQANNVLDAHQVPPGPRKRTDTSRRPGFPTHLRAMLVLGGGRR